MKMKTSNLSGVAIDWAVAKCEGFRVELDHQYTEDHRFNGWWQCGPHHWQPLCAYSTDWSQGGPIIEREGIYLRAVRYGGHPMNGKWLAQESDSNTGTMVQWVKREDWRRHYYAGPTLLIAAMRCYVASKLGDEIDIPEELK